MGNNNQAQQQQDRENEFGRINNMSDIIRAELQKLSVVIQQLERKNMELELENAKLRLLLNEGSRLLKSFKDDYAEEASEPTEV